MLFFKKKKELVDKIKKLEKENVDLMIEQRRTTDTIIKLETRKEVATAREKEIREKYENLLMRHTETLEKIASFQKEINTNEINTNELERLRRVVSAVPVLNDERLEIIDINCGEFKNTENLELMYVVRIKARERFGGAR